MEEPADVSDFAKIIELTAGCSPPGLFPTGPRCDVKPSSKSLSTEPKQSRGLCSAFRVHGLLDGEKLSMSKNPPEPRVWRLTEAPEHPLARQDGITERQFRRWVAEGKISYARPGGLIVILTDDDIEDAILGTRVERTR